MPASLTNGQLPGSSWDADATVLRATTLVLIHSTAENCAPIWCRSAHICFINKSINDVFCIVTRCLRPMPTDNLFALASNQPTELRRQKVLLSLGCRAQEPEHLLYKRLLSPLCRQLRQLKSRQASVLAALELLNNPAQLNTSVATLNGRKMPLDPYIY